MVTSSNLRGLDFVPGVGITPETAGDPSVYIEMLKWLSESAFDKAMGRSANGHKPVSAQQAANVIAKACQKLTGRSLEQAAKQVQSPLVRFRDLMVKAEPQIVAVEKAFERVDGIRVTQELPAPTFEKAVRLPQTCREVLTEHQRYANKIMETLNGMCQLKIEPLDAGRLIDLVDFEVESVLGETLEDIAREFTNPLRYFNCPMELPEDELHHLRDTYRVLDDVTGEEKERWDDIIFRSMKLQNAARNDPAKGMVYVLRDADPARAGQVLELEWWHLWFFDTWMDPKHPYSLIMAFPGSGKTTAMRWWNMHEWGHTPELRTLLLLVDDDTAQKECMTQKNIIRMGRYRALFPDVRILGRKEQQRERSDEFTIGRKNSTAREATCQAVGRKSQINGQGFDRIRPDDMTPPEARQHEYLRREIFQMWHGVAMRRMRDPVNSRITMICTPWHPDDLANKYRKESQAGRSPLWRVEVDRFVHEDDEHGDPIPLWPRKFDVSYLKQARFEDPDGYQLNYKLNPRRESIQVIQHVWFYNSTNTEWAANDEAVLQAIRESERYLSIDPSGSAGAASADTGVADFALTRGGYGFFTDALTLHVNPTEVYDWIANRIYDAYIQSTPYYMVLIEAQGPIKGMVSTWEDYLPKKLVEAGMPNSVLPIISAPGVRLGAWGGSANPSKIWRLREASPYINHGIVRFAGRRALIEYQGKSKLQAIPGSSVYKATEVMREFDGTNRADVVDAISQVVLLLKSRLVNPFAKQQNAAAVETGPVDELTRRFRDRRRREKEQAAKEIEPGSAWDQEEAFFASRQVRVS